MQCEMDDSAPSHTQQHRLTKTTEEEYPELRHDADPVAPLPSELYSSSYRCRKCSRTLFRHSSILSHPAGDVGGVSAAFGHNKKACGNLSGGGGNNVRCTSYFIEPVQWMEHALLGVTAGQLLCPKCRSKLGSFRWCGDRCSCGRWVTPAFQLHRNRVDQMMSQNSPVEDKVLTPPPVLEY